jgi:hypothetical protein
MVGGSGGRRVYLRSTVSPVSRSSGQAGSAGQPVTVYALFKIVGLNSILVDPYLSQTRNFRKTFAKVAVLSHKRSKGKLPYM